jgi:hypothetical protein
MCGELTVVYPYCDAPLTIFHVLVLASCTTTATYQIKGSLHDVHAIDHTSFVKMQLSLPVLALHCSFECIISYLKYKVLNSMAQKNVWFF